MKTKTATADRTFALDVKVGIYDTEYSMQICADRVVVRSPYVRWRGNTGGLAFRRDTIEDKLLLERITAAMAEADEDEIYNEVWALVGGAIGDDYLRNQ